MQCGLVLEVAFNFLFTKMRLVDQEAVNQWIDIFHQWIFFLMYCIIETSSLLYCLQCSFKLQVFLYGGYFKEIQSDKSSSERGVVHADMWSLDPRTWQWNKVVYSGLVNHDLISSFTCPDIGFCSSL